jgi:NTP pyrophosphatase (non-canonical NTP hydrolase)|tara:strand:- start:276 stop:596 length:321 start_codon:yes stop_codon:yes gene_type:complete
MKLNEYQDEARKTAIYPVDDALTYVALGLCGESGEVAEKIKKWIRGDDNGSSLKENLLYELGDVLWYLSNLAFELDFTLEEVARVNLDKLWARKISNKIKGNGDDR